MRTKDCTEEEYKARRYAKSREWALKNPEKTRAYGRAFYKRNQEKRKAYSKKYNELHREERRAYRREYSRRKKESMTEEERYAELVSSSKKTLNEYLYNSMERDRAGNTDKIQDYYVKYPFEEYGERAIKHRLSWFGIHKNKAMYDECYDAGVMAYMYSIHRCAASGYDYFLPYFYKMIRIYILCALIVYNDSKNLCKINGIKQICIDNEENMKRY